MRPGPGGFSPSRGRSFRLKNAAHVFWEQIFRASPTSPDIAEHQAFSPPDASRRPSPALDMSTPVTLVRRSTDPQRRCGGAPLCCSALRPSGLLGCAPPLLPSARVATRPASNFSTSVSPWRGGGRERMTP